MPRFKLHTNPFPRRRGGSSRGGFSKGRLIRMGASALARFLARMWATAFPPKSPPPGGTPPIAVPDALKKGAVLTEQTDPAPRLREMG
jgi:hypothetical protein